MTLDRFFKPALLVLLSATLYLAWGMKDNGRYVYEKRPDGAQDILLDTRTGRLFYLYGGERYPASVEVNPINGETTNHWAWPK
jgi:hypothetical protein